MNRRRTRAAVPALVGTIGLLAAAGCSGDGGRGYAVPGSVCGVPLKQDVVSPLLPDGEVLRETGEALPARSDICVLSVDDKTALTLRFSPVQEPVDPGEESESYRLESPKPLHKLPFAGQGAVGDMSATISAECGGGGPAPHVVVDLKTEEGVESDLEQRRDAMATFLQQYVAGALEQVDCGA